MKRLRVRRYGSGRVHTADVRRTFGTEIHGAAVSLAAGAVTRAACGAKLRGAVIVMEADSAISCPGCRKEGPMSATDDLLDLLELPMGPGLASITLGTLLDPANLSTILTALADTHGLTVCSGAAVDAGWFTPSTFLAHDPQNRADDGHFRDAHCDDEPGCRPLYLPASGEA